MIAGNLWKSDGNAFLSVGSPLVSVSNRSIRAIIRFRFYWLLCLALGRNVIFNFCANSIQWVAVIVAVADAVKAGVPPDAIAIAVVLPLITKTNWGDFAFSKESSIL